MSLLFLDGHNMSFIRDGLISLLFLDGHNISRCEETVLKAVNGHLRVRADAASCFPHSGKSLTYTVKVFINISKKAYY